MKTRRSITLAVALALATSLSGCLEFFGVDESEPMDVLMFVLGGASPAKKEKTTINESADLSFSGDMGGLSGTYDFDFYLDDENLLGNLSGTAKIKKGRFITITDKGSEDLFTIVRNVASQYAGGDVTITKAKGKLKGFQTPGGVDSTFTFSVKFKGTVDSGPMTGGVIKKGTLSAGSTFANFK